jgi:large subunit ribosomal protein L12
MEYVYGALLLNAAGKPIDEKALTQVLSAAGLAPDQTRVKALLASLEGLNLKEVLTKAETFAAPAGPITPAGERKEAKGEKKEEEKKEEKAVTEEEAAEGLSALFG